jgi:inner membrane protein
MDIITQGLVGAAVAQSAAKGNEVRVATLIGFVAPLLADADVFLSSSDDPLLFLEYHRHFTHALLFIPIGALLATLLLWPVVRKKLPFWKIYFYALLGYATAGVVDAFTSYGTHLLWPFNNERIAWSIISIVDPVFSLAFAVAIVVGLVKRHRLSARLGLLFAAFYLLLGVFQFHRAEAVAYQLAEQRGHAASRLIVKPSIGNLILWRTVYQQDDHYWVDAVRVGLFNHQIFNGERIAVFERQKNLPELSVDSTVAKDIERFKFFSDGYLAWHPELPNVIGDLRYALVPNSIYPLWGIELSADSDEHVKFEAYRETTEEERELFIEMLFDNH